MPSAPKDPFKPIRKGDSPSATRENALSAFVKRLSQITVQWPLFVKQSAVGVQIGMAYIPAGQIEMFIAREAIEPGGSGIGRMRRFRFSSGSEEWEDSEDSDANQADQRLYDSIGDIVAKVGDKIWAFWCIRSKRWEILRVQCT